VQTFRFSNIQSSAKNSLDRVRFPEPMDMESSCSRNCFLLVLINAEIENQWAPWAAAERPQRDAIKTNLWVHSYELAGQGAQRFQLRRGPEANRATWLGKMPWKRAATRVLVRHRGLSSITFACAVFKSYLTYQSIALHSPAQQRITTAE
jgi:hypothetical protein